MKKILHSVLSLSVVCVILTACSNGEYVANPSGAANSGVNPLKPLTSEEFTWSGTGAMEADINGKHFKADTSGWYLDSSGTNVFMGASGSKSIVFALNNVYAVHLYSMSYHILNTQAAYVEHYVDTKAIDTNVVDYYASYLGNSGEVKITENDSAYIRGLFYFQGVTTEGKLVTVSNGVFNIKKPL
ncbi:MAG: hypothetical protein JWQ38_2402 [Flavipsychrobacter sp.]|nr:hypothetical protein [Flavipsychrobacter sp.]